MHETSAQGWRTGKTQRDGVEREVGGGSGWGIHVNPWLIHVNVWQKTPHYCKVISLQLIKINGGKKKKTLTLVKWVILWVMLFYFVVIAKKSVTNQSHKFFSPFFFSENCIALGFILRATIHF